MQVNNPGSARAALIRAEIERAFSDVAYPGDGAIAGYSNDESMDLQEGFKGKHWRAIPRDTLQHHHDGLPFLSPAGLQFYLPTYLFAGLDDFWDIRDFVVYFLCPFKDPSGYKDRRDYFQRRFGHLTSAQKKAVRAFLEFVKEEKPEPLMQEAISAALDEFWERP